MLSIIRRNNLISYIHALDNWCDDALDLSSGTEGKLTVGSQWPIGTHCQWLISAIDDQHYINLEFESLDVSNKHCRIDLSTGSGRISKKF